jgi:lipopolysaccharide export LptBFGC system permease protein LptF
MPFPELTGWHKSILTLTILTLVCAAIAMICRFKRKRIPARIFFILFMLFLLSGFTILLVYANKVVEENKAERKTTEESCTR